MSGILPAITRYSTHRLIRMSAVPPVEITIEVTSKPACAAVLLMGVFLITGLRAKLDAVQVQLWNHAGERATSLMALKGGTMAAMAAVKVLIERIVN
jgi:hypothetical protein